MPTQKVFRGIAHDLAHHAQSGLGWVHPHLAQACRQAGVSRVQLELLVPSPYPSGLPRLGPLEKALGALKAWFEDLVARLGHDINQIASTILEFSFREGEDYNSAVKAAISMNNGKKYAAEVDYI
jgi:hypothetical protein